MTTTDTVRVEMLAVTDQAIKGMNTFAEKVAAALGPTHALGKAVYGGAAAYNTLMGALNPYIAIAKVAARVVGDMINEYAEAEKVTTQLSNAFKTQGDYLPETITKLSAYALSLSSITVYGEEATMQAMAMLKQLTHLDADGIKAIIPSIQDFAAGMGLDLVSAATLVAKTIGSDTNALSRYGIEVKAGQSESIKLAILLEELESKFGGLAAAVGKTTAGQLEIFKNQIGELKEAWGGLIVKTGGLNALIAFFGDWTEILSGNFFGPTQRALAKNQKEWEDYFKAIDKAAKDSSDSGVGAELRRQMEQVKKNDAAVVAAIKAVKDMNEADAKAVLATKEHAEWYGRMFEEIQNYNDPSREENKLLAEKIKLYELFLYQSEKGTEAYIAATAALLKLTQVSVGGGPILPPSMSATNPGPDQSSLVDWGPDSIIMLEAMAEAMHGLGKNAVKAKTEIDTFLESLGTAAMGEAINAMKALGEAWGSGKAVDAGAIIYDMAEAILAQMAALALGAAAACAIRFDWVGMWIWFGIAGVSALAGGYMAGAQASAEAAKNKNWTKAETGEVYSSGTVTGPAGNVAGRSVVVHVHGSVWSGEDLGQQLSRAMARA